MHGGIRIVELLCPCLSHRCHDLVANLDRPFALESYLMRFLHLVDLRLLLLHDFGQLELVLQLQGHVASTASATLLRILA